MVRVRELGFIKTENLEDFWSLNRDHTNFEFSVASDIDFEDLIADIGFGTNLVALLTQEEGFENLKIRLYPPKNEEFWEFRLDEFMDVVQRAKFRLGELQKDS